MPLYLKYKMDQSSEREFEASRRMNWNESRLSSADTITSHACKASDSLLQTFKRPDVKMESYIPSDLAHLLKSKLRTALYTSLGNIPDLPEKERNLIVSHHQHSLCDVLNDREGLEEESVFLRHDRESAALHDAMNVEMERQRSILMQKLRHRSRVRLQWQSNQASSSKSNEQAMMERFVKTSRDGNSSFSFPCVADTTCQVQQRPQTCKSRLRRGTDESKEAANGGRGNGSDQIKTVLQSAVERLKLFLSSETTRKLQRNVRKDEKGFQQPGDDIFPLVLPSMKAGKGAKDSLREDQAKKKTDDHVQGEWVRKISRRSGKSYYLNTLTKETRWKIPSELQ
ncbi:hypothetical protein GUITHDRAFT_109665 [Guillardia theta CCMP2712]|uniref:WW domain-containing protein n=1 Tax=Guillardia theta (strain CCMP2712) TaxID=905079 RepID=L1J8Z9_GUITC|nr:hypothetical protein GUITHDRAFT_109665 [Guillardia theta CCMP2712]EKX44550.1 hypothetical protein GUITHDRAFT_109665 [Guillardia theta CCMP2712]|eukprot:XP_005831530.1 hypothetical protein GUITHDRAFT_109665 [Guillardia theta CCMP2712]